MTNKDDSWFSDLKPPVKPQPINETLKVKRKQFEHKEVYAFSQVVEEQENGWELVSAVWDGGRKVTYFYLKREIV